MQRGELREDYGSLRGTAELKANFFEDTEPKHLFSVFKIYFRKTEKEVEETCTWISCWAVKPK